jgi:Tfp pilus assembly protein PilV
MTFGYRPEAVSKNGFSYLEVILSLFLLLMALLFLGRMNMTSLKLLSNAKINQKATLLLLEKIEELRATPIEDLLAGEFEQDSGPFSVRWEIRSDTPYFGAKQIQCRVTYKPASTAVVESIFYRSE